MPNEMQTLVDAYAWPSQAYWRYFELRALRRLRMAHPVLEIGCGDGAFSSLVFEQIEEAVDINPNAVQKAKASGLYGRVSCRDARCLQNADGQFATVYANCVMEHIRGIDAVLGACFRVLRAGGQLVMTVPLAEMNRHLSLSSNAYAAWRQNRLSHHNLFDQDRWCELLQGAGFTGIECVPYLGANACRFWDRIDVAGCAGYGRYCVATGLRFARRGLRRCWLRAGESPKPTRLTARITRWLERNTFRNEDLSEPCAVLITARR